jgi:hypothetical protein
MPNSTYVTSTHIGEINEPNKPEAAHTTRLFPHLSNFLLSLCILFDNGCPAAFMKNKCYIYYNRKVILKGSHNQPTNFPGTYTLATTNLIF